MEMISLLYSTVNIVDSMVVQWLLASTVQVIAWDALTWDHMHTRPPHRTLITLHSASNFLGLALTLSMCF
jgi:hypothetical protein